MLLNNKHQEILEKLNLEKNKIEKEKEIKWKKIKLKSMNDNNKYEEDKDRH